MELLNSKLTGYLVSILLFALVQWQTSSAIKKDAVRHAELSSNVSELNEVIEDQRVQDSLIRLEIAAKDSIIGILNHELDSLGKEQKKIRNANWKALKEIDELRDIAGTRPDF